MKTELTQPAAVESRESQARPLQFVIITPARNEAAFIEETITAMIAQTVKPLRWVIVSDGSTDGTDEIVKRHAAEHDWIELVRAPERTERHFAGKVHAFNAGYAKVKHLEYDVIGNLDADITFDPEYFAFLLKRIADNPKLGVAGTPYTENATHYDYRFTSIEHVSGACQLFRRECFEAIGGYVPIRIGGIDLMAVITARMKGWQTRSFPEKQCFHHRVLGTAKQHALLVALRGGHGDYRLGMHPLWEYSRFFYQVTRRPYVLGAVFRVAGYTWAMLSRADKLISPELVRFRRAEQMRRLSRFLAWKKRLQSLFWVYLTDNFYIQSPGDVKSGPSIENLRLLPITSDNYFRVGDFRENDRITEYGAKLAHREIGFFAQSDTGMVGSIWATVNTTGKRITARSHIPLEPGEALIHDIVTGERSRGMGVGPFMVAGITAALFADHGAGKVIVDVNSRNRPSIRMMNKAGVYAQEQVLSVSLFGRLLLGMRIRKYR